jgi:uncharacterized protein (DUF1800 family)
MTLTVDVRARLGHEATAFRIADSFGDANTCGFELSPFFHSATGSHRVYIPDMDLKLRALNRFGLGARRGESRTIDDPREWLHAQLEAGPPLLNAPDSASAIAEALRAFRQRGQRDPQQRQAARRRLVEIALGEARAALENRVTTRRPFVERLVAFWSNHLCVSAAAKVVVAPLAGSYERDAIRPHVLGKFEDMVLASAKHPAMLVYLDNFQSIGPSSRAAQLARRQRTSRGLNENYARELLELHTLGVNGGYTQQDVQELARILTGWTIVGLLGPGRAMRRSSTRGRLQTTPATDDAIGFQFQEALHEPGARTVLGSRYREDGVAQGERVIRDLCRHPSTAAFVATKLVTHFVADDPPSAAVGRIARVFRESGGDLGTVSRALIELPEAWDASTRKFRSPQDWLVAALRAFEVDSANEMTVGVLRQLRQPLWSPQAPKGFGDSVQEWADPDSLLNRAELARTFARRFPIQDDPGVLLDVVDVADGDPMRKVLADRTISAADRMALGVAGPAFQWR